MNHPMDDRRRRTGTNRAIHKEQRRANNRAEAGPAGTPAAGPVTTRRADGTTTTQPAYEPSELVTIVNTARRRRKDWRNTRT